MSEKIKEIKQKVNKRSFWGLFSYWKIAGIVLFGLLIVFVFKAPASQQDFSLLSARLTESNDELTPFIEADQLSFFDGPQLTLIEKTTLKGYSSPETISSKTLGSLIDDSELIKHGEINSYLAQEGDTLSSIASKFNISLNTLLWANDLSSKSSIKLGQELIILPVSGAMHLVKPGDTLGEIAQDYKGGVSEIALINNLDEENRIYTGDLLIIPGGRPPTPSLTSSSYVPLANHYFIYPIPAPHRITQKLHSFNAIDFSNGKCGEPVYAAAGGTVQKTGYHSIAGRYVRVLHPNGVVTFYGHLSKSLVYSGEKVSQGTIIGYVGHSGYTVPADSGGCHLHFEVRGAKNPFQ